MISSQLWSWNKTQSPLSLKYKFCETKTRPSKKGWSWVQHHQKPVYTDLMPPKRWAQREEKTLQIKSAWAALVRTKAFPLMWWGFQNDCRKNGAASSRSPNKRPVESQRRTLSLHEKTSAMEETGIYCDVQWCSHGRLRCAARDAVFPSPVLTLSLLR